MLRVVWALRYALSTDEANSSYVMRYAHQHLQVFTHITNITINQFFAELCSATHINLQTYCTALGRPAMFNKSFNDVAPQFLPPVLPK